MKSTLIIPNKIQTTVPKPNKNHVLEALMDKALKRHEKEMTNWENKWNELNDNVIKLVKEELVRKLKTNPEFEVDTKVDSHYWRDCFSAPEVSLSISTPAITKAQDAVIRHNKKRPSWYPEEMKKKIKASLTPPNPLLGNEQVDKALEQLLDTVLSDKTKVIEA